MAVFSFLIQLYGATHLTKSLREQGSSWKETILMGLAVGAVLATFSSLPYRSECAGQDMYGGVDCEYVEQEATPWHEGFLTTTAVGLAAVASRRSYEQR